MFFVYDDERQIVEGKQHRRTYTNHQGVSTLQDSLPHFYALVVGEARVVDTHPVAEDFLQPYHNLGRQGNLRKQIQHLSAPVQYLLNEVNVNFGFAATRDAVEQYRIQRLKLL